MSMKNHGDFTRELFAYLNARHPSMGDSFNNATGHEIVKLSRMGLAPEGQGSTAKNKLADLIYGMPESYFDHEVKPAPIAPPEVKPVAIVIPPVSRLPSTAITPVGYAFGDTSKTRLNHLIEPLRAVAYRAIQYSLVDMMVLETCRTKEAQATAVRNGKSKTMESKHRCDRYPDGLSRAVDLGAYVNGEVSWEFDYYYYIARAMDRAATELNMANHIRWGCVWDRVLSDFGNLSGVDLDAGNKQAIRADYLNAIEVYKTRHPGKDFLDGPHFEWVA